MNYSYIYHKATEIRQLNAIDWGAPSCSQIHQIHGGFPHLRPGDHLRVRQGRLHGRGQALSFQAPTGGGWDTSTWAMKNALVYPLVN